MTKTMEDNRWWKEKRIPIIKYLREVKETEDLVAGNGLLYRPGYLGGIITDVEGKTKFLLSDINYEIVKAAIERELIETGHDYDIAVRDAQVAWELEKAGLLTDLQEEFADNKRVRNLDVQEMDRLEVTTNLRKLVILAAKVEIDIDIQELNQELTNVERSTFAAKDALLTARLVTAEKKLTIIPYIESLIDKQQDIIDAETANADRKTALISAKETLNDKRAELITAREAIAAALIPLIAAREALVAKKVLLVTAREAVSAQESTNVGYLNQYITALTGLSTAEQALITAKKALIPYINAKSLALIAYTAELDAWVAVKEAIAAIKEDIAEFREDRVVKRGEIIDERVTLNALGLALQSARISLQMAKMTGQSSLLSAKIINAGEWLSERSRVLGIEIGIEGELISGQIDVSSYEEQISFETMEAVNDLLIDAEIDGVERIAAARIEEKTELASIASEAKITSQLVHLLA